MSIIGERILEERERLDLSQQELADLCGITIRSQRNYEKGDRSPDTNYLAAIAAAGADVLYIVTGMRNEAMLNKRETALLDNYRNSPEALKRNADETLSTYAQLQSKKKASGE